MPKRIQRVPVDFGPNTKNAGGYRPTTKYNERNVNAGGRYEPDAPGLTRDTTARVIKGPGRG